MLPFFLATLVSIVCNIPEYLTLCHNTKVNSRTTNGSTIRDIDSIIAENFYVLVMSSQSQLQRLLELFSCFSDSDSS